MPYRTLHLQNFRSYADRVVTFGDAVNVIVGPNGSGKTNLLEALYVLSTGSSFRVADRDLTRHDADLWRLEAAYDDSARVVAYDASLPKQQKQFSLDGVKRLRLGHDHKLPVVLFEPEHLRLLHGSPVRRRDYLDDLLSRLQPDFSRVHSRYERTLQQRNSILKEANQTGIGPEALDDQLFAWDISLAELAESIVERRRGLLTYMNQQLGAVYSQIAKRPHELLTEYLSVTHADNYKHALITQLHTHRAQDIRRGYTSVGPHRDDFSVHINGSEANLTASRGEIRTIVLALKMLELALFGSQSVRPPLLLLDDVFSELDQSRRTELAGVARQYQTVITTTDADSAGEFATADTVRIAL